MRRRARRRSRGPGGGRDRSRRRLRRSRGLGEGVRRGRLEGERGRGRGGALGRRRWLWKRGDRVRRRRRSCRVRFRRHCWLMLVVALLAPSHGAVQTLEVALGRSRRRSCRRDRFPLRCGEVVEERGRERDEAESLRRGLLRGFWWGVMED